MCVLFHNMISVYYGLHVYIFPKLYTEIFSLNGMVLGDEVFGMQLGYKHRAPQMRLRPL
jgi:hypothetical protein